MTNLHQDTNGHISHETIAERAYEIYLARGGKDGLDEQDWLQAEEEIRALPITTSEEEGEVRGAEAAAVEEKRAAEDATA